ncbi:hypothetical protein C8J57DRAFT_1295560 [Mycena rebaudengoi]|nr:hypothetical protein C8J57DRAFT_1295560 [Mycena rebaudengoi]
MFSRIQVARRVPRISAVPRRFTSSLKEGTVAQPKGFSEKERAHEKMNMLVATKLNSSRS